MWTCCFARSSPGAADGKRSSSSGRPVSSRPRSSTTTAQGQRLFVQGNVTLLKNSRGEATGTLAVLRDITRRKQAEEKAQANRAELEAALAAATDAVFISDAEGRLVDFNEAFATFHRFKNKDECGKAEYAELLDVFLADGELARLDQWAVPPGPAGRDGCETPNTPCGAKTPAKPGSEATASRPFATSKARSSDREWSRRATSPTASALPSRKATELQRSMLHAQETGEHQRAGRRIQAYCGEKPFPKREIHAVWIATVSGLDWPKSEDPVEQQQSLRMMVDKLHRAHFNTIFFQVRGRADAMYRSHYEPWSQQLTGTLGQDPHWDPLEFILTEAHARGMEVHAWFNTFLVRTGSKPTVSSPLHVILQHPEWVQQTEDEWWFDPGIPAVRDYVLNVAMDIVKNYDIDGLYFDYIRYPAHPLSDEATYKRYGKGLPKDEWRRENINSFVHAFHDQALSIKPMLKIGSAPLGVYMDIGKGRALQGYAEVFQDSRRWLRERVQDYLAPQVYWSLGDRFTNPDFVLIANDWLKNSYGRQIVVGIGAYKQDVFEEIPLLIDTSRTIGAAGNSFFRYASIHEILDLQGRYRYPATIPPMPWKDDVPPNAPQFVHVDNIVDGIFHIQWQQPLPASDGDRAKYFTVYRSPVKPVDVDDAANILQSFPLR